MKKLLLLPLLLCLSLTQAQGATKGDKSAPRKKAGQKKRLTRPEMEQLQKKTQRDARRHENEMRRQEFRQMQAAQRRGMQQQMQQQPQSP